MPLVDPNTPASWNVFIKDWVKQQQLPGDFAIFTQRASGKDLDNNQRMEIIDL
jgi:hypothetical protein